MKDLAADVRDGENAVAKDERRGSVLVKAAHDLASNGAARNERRGDVSVKRWGR